MKEENKVKRQKLKKSIFENCKNIKKEKKFYIS